MTKPLSDTRHFFLCASISVLLTATLLSITLRLDRVDLDIPFNYLGDANIFLVRAKSIADGNWGWSNPQLGAPFEADWRDFPMNIGLDSSWMWLISRFTKQPGRIVNLTWLIGILATAALATYAFLRLRFSGGLAIASGVIFAQLPY